jgi:hypothetical protein
MGQTPPEEEARGFVGSVAATVYKTAWPTARYESAAITSVSRVPLGGLDVLVRLSGESRWGGELWIDLAFEFRDGGFFGLKVRDHNAILVPPFATAKTVGAMTLALVEEFDGDRADRATPSPASPSPAPLATREIQLANSCGHPVQLWLRYRASASRWRVDGVWSLSAADTTFLADADNRRLRLAGPDISFYAEVPDGGANWAGTVEVPYGSRTFQMREATLPVNADGSYNLGLRCDDYIAAEDAPQQPLVIGVLIQDLESFTIAQDTLTRGILVRGLQEGFPAKRAGMAVGDVIVSVDQQRVHSTEELGESLNDGPAGPRLIGAFREELPRTFEMTPTVAPTRSSLDHERCQAARNPPDYWLGAVAAPFASSGVTVIPQYPGTTGFLFAPDELEISYRTEPFEVFIVHGKPIRDDIVRFDYYDRDRAMIAVTEAGESLDLGVRIECLVQPGIAGASEITLRRAHDGREVSARTVPLRQAN